MLEREVSGSNWKTEDSATYSKGQTSQCAGKSVLGKDVKSK